MIKRAEVYCTVAKMSKKIAKVPSLVARLIIFELIKYTKKGEGMYEIL